MPSTDKAAKGRKAAASVKSRGEARKTAPKSSATDSAVRSVKVARRSGTSARAKPPATAAKKTSTKTETKNTAKSVAKSGGKTAVAAKKSAATNKGAGKGVVAKASRTKARGTVKSALSTKAGAPKAGASKKVAAKPAASKTVRTSVKTTSRSVSRETSKVAARSDKRVSSAARGSAGKKPRTVGAPKIKASESENKAAIATKNQEKNQEKDTKLTRPEETNVLNPVVNAPAQLLGLRPSATASITPAASEPIKVAKNIPENAAKAAAPKSIPPIAAAVASGDDNSGAMKLAPSSTKIVPSAPKVRPAGQKHGFKLSEFIVYPAHGVGQIVGIEVQEVAGFSLELFVVSFIKDKMILKVPTSKVTTVGMRKLAQTEVVDKALGTLSGRARIKRTMWSRRAQEYEAKINSGDLVTIAEVVRDLYRSDTQPEQSYSERQLYEAALDRMAREVAAVRKLIDAEALRVIESFLLKGPRRGAKSDAEMVADVAEDSDVDRAA
jgi:CarD family transcriptional regulator